MHVHARCASQIIRTIYSCTSYGLTCRMVWSTCMPRRGLGVGAAPRRARTQSAIRNPLPPHRISLTELRELCSRTTQLRPTTLGSVGSEGPSAAHVARPARVRSRGMHCMPSPEHHRPSASLTQHWHCVCCCAHQKRKRLLPRASRALFHLRGQGTRHQGDGALRFSVTAPCASACLLRPRCLSRGAPPTSGLAQYRRRRPRCRTRSGPCLP